MMVSRMVNNIVLFKCTQSTYFTAIRIGFELPSYTYLERMFDEDIDDFFEPESGLAANGPVFLAKEDNVTSEQTFLVVIQTSGSVPPGKFIEPATLGVDYRLPGSTTVVVLQFPPRFQRINFPFTLLFDTLPEGTEAFLASSAPEDTAQLPDGTTVPLSTYLHPNALFSESFIIIEDDDREFIAYIDIIIHIYLH